MNVYRFLPHCAKLMRLTPSCPPHAKVADTQLEWQCLDCLYKRSPSQCLSLLPQRWCPHMPHDGCLWHSCGSSLQQYVDSTWRPISFSRKMTPAETHYSTFDRELLAASYLAIKHFCHFLEGRRFMSSQTTLLHWILIPIVSPASPSARLHISVHLPPPLGTFMARTTWLPMHPLALRLALCSLASHQP